MRSKVIYEEMLLLSLKEGRSKKIEFNTNKNIIYGKNDTGKSTLIKSIFWTLGLNPTKLFGGNRLDRNLIGLLKIKYNNEYYYIFRNKDTHKFFDVDKNLLLETESNSEWHAYLAIFFNYKLSLIQRNNLEEYLVGLQGILTPYYIDQDSGWSHKWDGPFEGMHRFYDFYQQVIEHFTGIISNEVIILKQDQKKLLNIKKELDIKVNIYESSAKELLNLEKDSKSYPEIDNELFQSSIIKSTIQIKETQKSQIIFRQQLAEVFNEKQIVLNLLKNAHNLYADAVADLDILYSIPENTSIECPTCGSHHEKTFEANIALEFDIEGINKNIFHLNQKLTTLKNEENILTVKLAEVNNEIIKFKNTLNQPISENYTLEDIVKSYSNTNIRNNIESNLETINAKISEIIDEIDQIKNKIDEIDSPEIIKENIEKLKKGIRYYYNQLNVDALDVPSRIHLKPNISGSSSSRSILSLHLAYISISYKLTNFPIFPIVIDTIQQNGQDDLNINNMIKIISMFKQPQIILGMETLSDNINEFPFKIIELNNEKYKVLDETCYSQHLKEINSFTDMSELNFI